jgi:hypothetical protein
MPTPSSSLATLRPDLSGAFEQFSLRENFLSFAATRLLTTIEVPKADGNFGIIPLAQLAKRQNTKRAVKSAYNRGDFQFTPASYQTTEYGWEELVDDREAAMYADYFDAELVSTDRALFRIMLDFELDVFSILQSTTVFTGQTTNRSAVWTDYANSKPVDDVKRARLAVYGRTGIMPNTVAMSPRAFEHCIESMQVIDRLQGRGAGIQALAPQITVQQLAAVFNVDQVVICGGTFDSANLGQPSSMAEAWSDNIVSVLHAARSNDFRSPCLGRSWHWAEDGSMPAGVMESYRDETVRGTVIRARRQMGFSLLYLQMAQLITNVTT